MVAVRRNIRAMSSRPLAPRAVGETRHSNATCPNVASGSLDWRRKGYFCGGEVVLFVRAILRSVKVD